MFRLVISDGVELLQFNRAALRVDANGAFCPGTGEQWVDVPRVQLESIYVDFESDPREWTGTLFREKILPSRTALSFWALWKKHHLTSQDFGAGVVAFAAAIDAAPVSHYRPEHFSNLFITGGFGDDFTRSDVERFFFQFADVFRGERLVQFRVKGERIDLNFRR